MKKMYIFILFTLYCIQLNSQIIFPSSNNISFMGRWDDNALPGNEHGPFNDLWGYAADDREYIVMGSTAYVHFIDVTDPYSLLEIARFEQKSWTRWRDFKTYQNYVYGVSDQSGEGLLIYDMQNAPNAVDLISADNAVFLDAHNCFIDEPNGRLYVVGTEKGSVIIFDLTADPTNPELLAIADLNSLYIHDIYVRDNIAYCSATNNGYYIYDLTDPNNPLYIASLPTNGYNHSSWVTENGEYALFAEEVPAGLPLGIMDLRNMMDDELEVSTYFQNPLIELSNPILTKNTAHNPYIKGDFAYVSYYEDGVHVYDISEPAEPILFGYIDTHPNTNYIGNSGCWGVYPFLPSGNLFASDRSSGLLSFKITDLTSTQNTASFANDIKIAPNPVTSTLNVDIVNEYSQDFTYTITNTLGQILQSGQLNNTRLTTNIQSFSKGIYYLNVFSKNESHSVKFVKQ